MLDSSRFRGRLLFFAMLLVVPIVRMLLREHYGLRPEALAVLFLAASLGALIAAVTRSRILLHIAAVLIITALSASRFYSGLLPHPRIVYAAAIAFVVVCVAMLVLRANFYRVAVVFIAGSFAVDIVKAATNAWGPKPQFVASAATSGTPRHHVVHVVLDAMAGLGAAPVGCDQCRIARASLERTFQKGNFTTYPLAFSNYFWTRHSVASIVTNRLFDRPQDYDVYPMTVRGAYFNNYLDRGYDLRVYQSDFITYAVPERAGVSVHTYKTADLQQLRDLTPSFGGKVKRLVAYFLRSDQFLTNACILLPSRLRPSEIQTAAIGAQATWSRMLDDIRLATKNTFFFAHLMIPHFPYIYSGDGAIRPPELWLKLSQENYYEGEEGAFRRAYEVFGGQQLAAARQLDRFLDGLRAAGIYDSSTIVIHGDHGSRIRIFTTVRRGVSTSEFEAHPDERDLRSSFGALLAIKPAGAVAPDIVTERGSILQFLRKQFSWPSPPGESDLANVYIQDVREGRYKSFPIRDVWKSGYTPTAEQELESSPAQTDCPANRNLFRTRRATVLSLKPRACAR